MTNIEWGLYTAILRGRSCYQGKIRLSTLPALLSHPERCIDCPGGMKSVITKSTETKIKEASNATFEVYIYKWCAIMTY